MSRHHLLAIVLFLIFVNSRALATVSFSASGYSNVTDSNGAVTYFYSNISDVLLGDYYDNASANSTVCSTTRNPNCKEPTSPFIVSVSTGTAPTVSSKMYLYADLSAVITSGGSLTGTGKVADASYTTANTNYSFGTLRFVDFCNKVGKSNCEGDAPVKISVVFDKNGDGVYNTTDGDEIASFTLYLLSQIAQYSNTVVSGDGYVSFTAFPGDAKIYFTNPQVGPGSDFPSLVNLAGVQKVRYYYTATTAGSEAVTLAAMTASGNNYKEASIYVSSSNEVSFSPSYANGLTNNQKYCVMTALVDNAGNIGMETKLADRVVSMCQTPDQVIGLMSQSGQCFIATAAFDSPLASQVDTLRKFRDVYLLKSQIGRNFVSWYYDHSPQWAAKIKNNENLKTITRAFLWPLVGYSFLSLKWGAANATLFAVTLLLLPILFIQFAFKKRETE